MTTASADIEARELDGLGFTVEAGTVFGLLGPNGHPRVLFLDEARSGG